MNRRRFAILTVAEGILSSLDSRESPRKIIDALVRDHGAQCRWSKGRWTFRLLRVSVDGAACSSALLQRWCDRALSSGSRPRLSDVAPIQRPALLCAQIGRAVSRLVPTGLLLTATKASSGWIERQIERLPDSRPLRPSERLLSVAAAWLTQEPVSGHEAREAVFRLRMLGSNVTASLRAWPTSEQSRRHSAAASSAYSPGRLSEGSEQLFVQLAPEAPAVRPQSYAPEFRTDQGPSTHPSVANRFRFSVRDGSDASRDGSAA